MRQRKIDFGVILGSFRDERNGVRRIAAASINCDFSWVPSRRNIKMPYATTSDHVQLYFEEAGQGTPILFIHEFAADYASWEPQIRYFSRSHRCITFSARGYIPSHIPEAEAYSYKHFRDDATAMLDFLEIKSAHLVGLSMGAYSALQV